MKQHAAAIHQAGGRHAYLPIQIPAANAIAAQKRGSRGEGLIKREGDEKTRGPRVISDQTASNVAEEGASRMSKSVWLLSESPFQANDAFDVVGLRKQIDQVGRFDPVAETHECSQVPRQCRRIA